MTNRKLMLLGSVLMIVIIAGFVTVYWNAGVTSDPSENNLPDNNTPNNQTDNPADNSSDNPADNPSDNTPDNSDATLTLDIDPTSGIIVHRATVTITSAGTYTISGTQENGRIIVDTNDEEDVTLILNGVNISSNTNAPICVENAQETFIVLADGTENYLTDNANNDEDSALFSRDNLTICGDGALTVSGNANDGIRSNNGLTIESGNISVTSIDDGIYGKDFLVIKGGDIAVNCVGDGLKAANVDNATVGYISIENGTIDVTSTEGDAITAQTDLSITGGTFILTCGGGSNGIVSSALSTKGLKAGGSIVIDGGVFIIDSLDDAINSNALVIINNGTFQLSSGDDGILAGTSLEVNGGTIDVTESGDGIKGTDVTINDGNVQIDSDDDGVSGEDSLVVMGGDITVHSVGDGLKAENAADETKGYLTIEAGTITVVSTRGDAITAQTDLSITGGTFTLTCGGGSNGMLTSSASTKGLKAGVSIVIDGGDFIIDSSDDAINSNDVVVINDGIYDIATGDDAIKADESVEINGGTIDITQCFEGIESIIVTINDGHIQLVSSDDGINVAEGGGGGVFMGGGGGFPGGGGAFPPPGEYYIYINGGFIYIESGGDGLDSDGYIEMSGGVVIINGPTSDMNGAIDYGAGSFTFTGGTLVAVGSSGMAQGPSEGLTSQYSLIVKFGSRQQANRLIHIETGSGQDVLTFRPAKEYQSLVFSSPELTTGQYRLYLGGSSTGTSSYGLYEGGTYTPGTLEETFTINSMITEITIGGGSTWPW